jgi:hypothetical protein
LDYGFYNQSEEVIRSYHERAKSNDKKRPVSSSAASDGSNENACDLANLATPPLTGSSPRRTLPQPVQDVARSYLFANYMTGGPRTGHMVYLVPLLESHPDHTLNAAVSAVALAAFSNLHASPKTMMKAHAEYATALRETNHSLRDPQLCKTDAVLATVIMLGMFEVSVFESQKGKRAAHVLANY